MAHDIALRDNGTGTFDITLASDAAATPAPLLTTARRYMRTNTKEGS